MTRRLRLASLGAVLLLSGCDTLFGGLRVPHNTLSRASKSGTIAISDDDTVVVMVNPEDGSVSAFDTTTLNLLSRVRTGGEPSAVVIHPDSTTAFVANRLDHTVVRVRNVHTTAAEVSPPIQVGAEPTGLALSPSGARLFVAEFGEGSVAELDTETLQVTRVIRDIPAPRALAVTNNGDLRDDDELLLVPSFFGQPVPGAPPAANVGRTGALRLFSLADLSSAGSISLQPLSAADAGFGQAAAPNQLYAVASVGARAFVPALLASPALPNQSPLSVVPAIHVVDVEGRAELRGAGGSLSLAARLEAALPGDPTRRLLADPVDVDFVPSKPTVAYVLSRGADQLLRVEFGPKVLTGSTMNQSIDLDPGAGVPCLGATGLVVAAQSQRAFVNCWLSRRLGVVDLMSQALQKTVAATDPPQITDVDRGRLLFHTARGRWSAHASMSCASCHPDGLSDSLTWNLGFTDDSGLRQTPSLAGAFGHGSLAAGATQRQRVFGWIGNLDEVHDLEPFVRDIANGLGAITTAATPAACAQSVGGDVSQEQPVKPLPAPLSQPLQEVQNDSTKVRCSKDWDLIAAYLRSLRPPRGRTRLDPAAVRRGAALFQAGGSGGACTKCHAGPAWTVSRLFYTPGTAQNTSLAKTVRFSRPAAWPATYTSHGTFQIADEPAGGGTPQVACAVRSVGTFGAGAVAETTQSGRSGYNVPSLYGLPLGAPFLHHGAAQTLGELLGGAAFASHTQSGAANFAPAGQDLSDLVSFLLSIDATTPELSVPAGFDAGCSAQ